MTLPRAISFTASLYSIGVPPELLGLGALDADDLAYVREVYPSFDQDMATALRYANEARVREVLGDDYARLARTLGGEVDRVHEGLTSAIWATIGRASTVNVPHYIAEAAQLRRFFGVGGRPPSRRDRFETCPPLVRPSSALRANGEGGRPAGRPYKGEASGPNRRRTADTP